MIKRRVRTRKTVGVRPRRQAHHPPRAGRGRPKQSAYPWVVAVDGQHVSRIGPMWNKDKGEWMTREEAQLWASTTLNCYFEVHMWPTVDPQRASSYVRALRLEQTGDLQESLKRMKGRPEARKLY